MNIKVRITEILRYASSRSYCPGDVRQENEITNQRISLLLTFQGLLFATLSFSWDKAPSLITVLCLTGIVVAASSWVVLDASEKAQLDLDKWWWENILKQGYTGPELIGHKVRGKARYLLPWKVYPILFVSAWILVLLIQAFH